MRTAHAFFLACALASWHGLSAVQASGLTATPTLAQALASAMQHDTTYQAAIHRATAKSEQIEISAGRLRPTVGISSTRLQVDQQLRNGTASPLFQNYPSQSDALVLRQGLYQPQLLAERKQAQFNQESAQAQLLAAQQGLVLRLANAFASAISSDRKSALLTGQMQVLKQQLAAAEKAMAQGTGIAAERDEVLAQIALLAVEQTKSSQGAALARTELAYITGWPAAELEALLQSQADPGRRLPASTEPLPVWLEKVDSQSQSLQDALMQVQAQSAGGEAAIAARMPTLDLLAQINKSRGENSFFISSRVETRSLGVQLNIPITQGGAELARQKLAVAQLREAQANADQVRSSVALNARKAYFAIEEFQSRQQALVQAQAAARHTLQVQQRGYASGLKTLLDVTQAQQRLLELQLESQDVDASLWLAHLQLRALATEAGFQ